MTIHQCHDALAMHFAYTISLKIEKERDATGERMIERLTYDLNRASH